MRVGIVGLACAYWPLAIGRGLQAKRGVKFLAAATLGESDSVVQEHLKISPAEYAEKFGVKIYADPLEMVARERLDTVAITTPHTQHARWVERMAALGVNIYIAKPFATTLEDARRILCAQKRYGVKIAVGPSDRYNPYIAAAKSAVDSGAIGEPFCLNISHNHGTIASFRPGDWYRNPAEGGPELSLGWYVIDLALYFLPRRTVRSIYALYENYTSPDSPFMDCGKLLMRMNDGAMVACEMYFCHRVPYPIWQIEAVGPKGVVKVHATGEEGRSVAATLYSSTGPKPIAPPKNLPDREVVWVDDFRRDRPPILSAEEAMVITRLSLAARDSARTGRPIAIR